MRKDKAVDTRIDIQEKVEKIIDAVDGMKEREIPVPREHLLCLMYGALKDPSHEVCQQMKHNLRRRYAGEHTYHMVYMDQFHRTQMDEQMIFIRESVENGYVSRNNVCYIPVIFLAEDVCCRELPEFIERLLDYFREEGTFQCKLDLYGLIDFSKADCADHWEVLCPAIRKMVHRQVNDLYFCSKDGIALNHIFSRAVDAIEMNLFMKTALPDRDFRDFWKVDVNASDQECCWKCIGYWKMDILVCTVCQYIIEMIDFQTKGSRDEKYKNEIRQIIQDFFYYELESKALERQCMSMPVSLEGLEELIGEPVSGKSLLSALFRPLREPDIQLYTYGDVINQLYGNHLFFEIFAEETVTLGEEKTEELKKRLLSTGTLYEIRELLHPVISELLANAKQEKEVVEDRLNTLRETRLNARFKDVCTFMRSVNQELLQVYCARYMARERYKVLDRLDDMFESVSFHEELNLELSRHEGWKRFLNAIISSSLPLNETEIKDILSQVTFYDHKRDNNLCWKDDIFEVLQKDDVLKQMIREIRGHVHKFVETERDSVIALFKSGIKRIYDEGDVRGSHAVDGLYAVKGVLHALEANRKECLLADKAFLNLNLQKEDGHMERNMLPIFLYSSHTCYPFTLEFFGLNESVNPKGIKGLYREGEN